MALALKDYLQTKRVPLMVYLELTHRCSFLCVHCYIPEAARWPHLAKQSTESKLPAPQPLGLSTDEVKKLLGDLAECQTLFVVFTGGEIFLRPDLEELTATAVGLGFSVKYYTNGFHITPRWADIIKNLGVYSVDMSVYGASEATYQAVTKVKGAYARVLASIKALSERKVRMTLKTPVLRENFRDIPAIKALAQRHGAFFRQDLVIIPRFDGDEAPFQHRLNDEEIAELLTSAQANFTAKTETEPHVCAVGKWSAVVSPSGEVYPCIELRDSLGNIRQRSFSEIWHDNPKMTAIREKLARMEANPAFADGLCGHCPAYSLRATGDMTQPSQEHMRIAEVKRKFIGA